MEIAIIDNYDSFTFNLVHLLRELGTKVTVIPNDRFDLIDLERFDKIVLSPGPCVPSQAGQTMNVIREYASRKSILGVCLGHQAIAEAFGAQLMNMSVVLHGIQSTCDIFTDDPLFSGLPRQIKVGLYHSWAVSKELFPDCLEITAISDEGTIMALRHRRYDVRGIQFHPESILTPDGAQLMANWLSL